MQKISRYFSKFLTGGIKNQLFFYVLLVGAIFVLFLLITLIMPLAGIIHEGNKTIYDPLWWTFLHFSYPGHLILDVGTPYYIKLFAVIITLAGMVLFEGMLISIIVHGLRSKTEIFKKGLVRFKHENHFIIIGWDTFGISIVKEILNEWNRNKTQSEIVILVDKNSEELQIEIKKSVDRVYEKLIHVYNGKLKDEEFKQLYINESKEIYVLGNPLVKGVNNANLEIVFELAKYRNNSNGSIINCYLNLPEIDTFNLLKKSSFPDEITKKLNIKPFNLNEGWVRKIWGSIDLQSYTDNKDATITANDRYTIENLVDKLSPSEYLQIVLIGFNEVGYSFLEHTLQMAHWGNSRTEIMVVDRNFKGNDLKFQAEFKYYKNIKDCSVKFVHKDFCDKEITQEFTDLYNSKKCKMLFVVCLNNSDKTFAVINLLPKEIVNSDVPIYIYQKTGKGFLNLIESYTNLDSAKNNVNFFGWNNEQCSFIKTREFLAEGIHKEYLKLAKSKGFYNENEPKYQNWNILRDVYKWSNRYQADSFFIKLRRIGKKLEHSFSNTNLYVFTKEEIELLARMEHDRWRAERVLNGWQYNNTPDIEKKYHTDLVPFDDLPESTKIKDYNAVEKMPYLLKTYCKLDIIN